jgi:hypothetical protein
MGINLLPSPILAPIEGLPGRSNNLAAWHSKYLLQLEIEYVIYVLSDLYA